MVEVARQAGHPELPLLATVSCRLSRTREACRSFRTRTGRGQGPGTRCLPVPRARVARPIGGWLDRVSGTRGRHDSLHDSLLLKVELADRLALGLVRRRRPPGLDMSSVSQISAASSRRSSDRLMSSRLPPRFPPPGGARKNLAYDLLRSGRLPALGQRVGRGHRVLPLARRSRSGPSARYSATSRNGRAVRRRNGRASGFVAVVE